MIRLAAALLVLVAVDAPSLAAATQTGAPAPPRGGFLTDSEIPNAVLILPPPPKPGSALQRSDETIVTETRRLQASPRWGLAARDAVNYLGAFDCALGLAVTASAEPKTTALLSRVGADVGRTIDAAKDHFARPRPFVGKELPICVERQRSGLAKSYSYPSGHAAFGWAAGLILAEMEPAKAADILARARAFGESRVVCGVHYPSDIEAGRTAGGALVAALHASPGFQAALVAAKAELTSAEASAHSAPDAGACTIDTEAEVHTPWTDPEGEK